MEFIRFMDSKFIRSMFLKLTEAINNIIYDGERCLNNGSISFLLVLFIE